MKKENCANAILYIDTIPYWQNLSRAILWRVMSSCLSKNVEAADAEVAVLKIVGYELKKKEKKEKAKKEEPVEAAS